MMPYLVVQRSLERMLAAIRWNRKCVRVNDDEGGKNILLCVGDRGAVVIDETTGEAESVPLKDVERFKMAAEASSDLVTLMKG
jgi:hypothetical protein